MMLTLQTLATFWLGVFSVANPREQIHDAVRDGQVFRVRLMLERDPTAANTGYRFAKGYPQSPVHMAAEHGQLAILKLLLAHGELEDPGAEARTRTIPVLRKSR